MDNDIKTDWEFLNKTADFRNRIWNSETVIPDRADEICASMIGSGGLPDRDGFYELEEMPEPLRVAHDSTGSSVSNQTKIADRYKIKGDIWASTFGILIQALPIPAFLIDEELNVAVSNQSCARLTTAHEQIQGKPFVRFFLTPEASESAESLIRQVLSDRKPRAAEGSLRIENAVIWAQMTFRPIRIANERFVLVLVEDLTREKNQLCENEALRRELEKQVEQRTAQLSKINEALRRKMAECKRADLEQVKTLTGLLPICASCKKIRDDLGHWVQVEVYVSDHTGASFTHSICPECTKEVYHDIYSTVADSSDR